ncbi:hypothetical protein B0H10DRAFT_2226491 [Mycena sp. CBHHK59/15]|nr:hypothetical protein B0H10DRAFT_2226491 [Mycena sp. CBHHK59/15]
MLVGAVEAVSAPSSSWAALSSASRRSDSVLSQNISGEVRAPHVHRAPTHLFRRPPLFFSREDQPLAKETRALEHVKGVLNDPMAPAFPKLIQYQPGELAVEHQLKAQFHVDLHYLHPHVEVEGGFLAIDSNGLPHVITAECQNPVPLGTPKIITKKTNTDTLGTNVVLATTGVGVTATASAALGAEHTKENQLPPNTPYASRISSTRIIGTTFEIIPFAEVAGAQPNSVSVDLHLAPSQTPGIGEAAIRKESNRFPLLASSRSNRGCLGRTTLDSNRIYGELRGMGTHVFVVPKLSPIYLAVRSGADAKTSYAIVTGLDYPTVITQDGTGYTGVLGLKSRLSSVGLKG